MNPILEITAEDLQNHQRPYILVDVREPEELTGPEGCIEGVILTPLGPALVSFLESADPAQDYVFICRSGVRSGKACALAHACGLQKVYNFKGGMIAWNAK